MVLDAPDTDGRRRPKPIPGSEFTRLYTDVISAVGQQPARLNVRVDVQTLSTERAGVFAGGDAVTGPATVAEAIASGRRAARAIDSYLGITETEEKVKQPLLRFNSEFLKKTKRVSAHSSPVDERDIDSEDTSCLTMSEVEQEANRCFNCGCLSVNASDIATALTALDARLKIAVVGANQRNIDKRLSGHFPEQSGTR